MFYNRNKFSKQRKFNTPRKAFNLPIVVKDAIFDLGNQATHELIVNHIKSKFSNHPKEIESSLEDLLKEDIIHKSQNIFVIGSEKFKDTNVACTITVTQGGFGYADSIDSIDHITGSIFIPKRFVSSCMSGDKVLVSNIHKTAKGFEGIVSKITERKLSSVIATVMNYRNNEYILKNNKINNVKLIARSHKQLNIGDIVSCSIDWASEDIELKEIKVDLKEVVGSIDDPKTDNLVAVLENNIPDEFSEEVIAETEEVVKNRYNFLKDNSRIDFREDDVITIDPDTSKDFDDGLSIKKLDDGSFELNVHIADVTHYVKKGGAIDKEAKNRCNSTYLPGEVVPMLPFALADDLCSLVPFEDRPTASVMMKMDKEGKLINFNVCKGIIKSKCRLTYRKAKDIIDGEEHEFKHVVMNLVELFNLMQKRRASEGLINIISDGVKVLVDSEGNPTGIEIEPYDITHQLIEMFMVKTNEVVSKFSKEGLERESIFRVHKKPQDKNRETFLNKMSNLGIQISKDPTSKDINNLLQKFKDTELGNLIQTDYIQHMSQAEYLSKNEGHFGLNLQFYSHFTSPIRRYSDIVLHRVIYDHEETSKEEIDEIAKRCSEKERISASAEKQSSRIKKLRLLKKGLEEDPSKQYQAVISDIFRNKINIEILGMQLSFPIFFSALNDDFYSFNEESRTLVGKVNGKKIGRGAIITLEIEKVDLITSDVNITILDIRPAKYK